MLRGWWLWCWAVGLVVGGCLAGGKRWLARTRGQPWGGEEEENLEEEESLMIISCKTLKEHLDENDPNYLAEN